VKRFAFSILLATLAPAAMLAQDQSVTIRFQAMVGGQKFACGEKYEGIGTTRSRITPRDFRVYVHDIRLVDDAGNAVPVQLEQDGKWQLDDLALLDFEDASGGCVNGTPEMNDRVVGRVAAGHYSKLRFSVGVPFNKNHTDLTVQPPPLNLTALSWVWNAGRKFARIDFSSTGSPRGYAIHLGSTGCTPNQTKITIPTHCTEPNRPEIEISGFDPSRDVVIADLAALLKDSNVDTNQENTAIGCMSAPDDSDCAPLFANLGLPFAGKPAGKQTFFRKREAPSTESGAGQ
jgi:uncharacterized repeat protein (TIGR04052 family)